MNTPTPYADDEPRIDVTKIDIEYVVSRAVCDHMNGHAPQLPPLHWSWRAFAGDARLAGLAEEGDTAAVEQWARMLGLDATKVTTPGTFGYAGTAEIGRRRTDVAVWCIVDRAAFNDNRSERLGRADS